MTSFVIAGCIAQSESARSRTPIAVLKCFAGDCHSLVSLATADGFGAFRFNRS
jgi:hypothetical protein